MATSGTGRTATKRATLRLQLCCEYVCLRVSECVWTGCCSCAHRGNVQSDLFAVIVPVSVLSLVHRLHAFCVSECGDVCHKVTGCSNTVIHSVGTCNIGCTSSTTDLPASAVLPGGKESVY